MVSVCSSVREFHSFCGFRLQIIRSIWEHVCVSLWDGCLGNMNKRMFIYCRREIFYMYKRLLLWGGIFPSFFHPPFFWVYKARGFTITFSCTLNIVLCSSSSSTSSLSLPPPPAVLSSPLIVPLLSRHIYVCHISVYLHMIYFVLLLLGYSW